MLELREEVEVEYADKMDELRAMYRDEMNLQVNSKFVKPLQKCSSLLFKTLCKENCIMGIYTFRMFHGISINSIRKL